MGGAASTKRPYLEKTPWHYTILSPPAIKHLPTTPSNPHVTVIEAFIHHDLIDMVMIRLYCLCDWEDDSLTSIGVDRWIPHVFPRIECRRCSYLFQFFVLSEGVLYSRVPRISLLWNRIQEFYLISYEISNRMKFKTPLDRGGSRGGVTGVRTPPIHLI